MKQHNKNIPVKESVSTLGQQIKPWIKKPWVIVALVAAFIFILTSIVFIIRVNYYLNLINSGQIINEVNITRNLRKETPAVISTENNFSLGGKNPKVTIVEFSDFTCPYCRELSVKLRNILSSFQQDVKLVYKDYPLVNEEGIDFALAGRCAGEQNEMLFWSMHDKFFVGQGLITPEDLPELAENTGLDKDQFNDCLQGKKYMDAIKADILEAESLNVEATPTIFINGHMLSGDLPEDILFKAIEEFLNNS